MTVLAARKAALGEDHPGTLTAAGNLAHTYSDQGKFAEALELQLGVLAARKGLHGEEDPATLSSAGNLANTHVGKSGNNVKTTVG